MQAIPRHIYNILNFLIQSCPMESRRDRDSSIRPATALGRLFRSKMPLSEPLLRRCFSRGREGMAQREGHLSLQDLQEGWCCQRPVWQQGRESLPVLQQAWLQPERCGGACSQVRRCFRNRASPPDPPKKENPRIRIRAPRERRQGLVGCLLSSQVSTGRS